MDIKRQKYTMEELYEFAEYLNKGNSLASTARFFNVNYDTLKNNLTRHGLRTPVRTVKNKVKINLNENYFSEIDTHKKAYFLGLLFSDGYICSNVYKTSKTVGIALQLEDKYILEEFKKELEAEVKISEYKNSAKLTISNLKMYKDLKSLGIKEKKSSKDHDFPPIKKEFYNSFILGYFDGDGCITIKATKAIVVTISGNSRSFFEQMQKILLENFDIETNIREETGKRKNPLYILYFKGRTNQLKFKNNMYSDSGIYLTRKHAKFMEIPC